jgi:hypothetical protein
MTLESENKALKESQTSMKKNFTQKIKQMAEMIQSLRVNANEIKIENDENFRSFQEVWPHLLNIFEYLGINDW